MSERERAGGRRSRPGDFELRFRKPESAICRCATLDAAVFVGTTQAEAMGRPVEVRRIGQDGQPEGSPVALIEPCGSVVVSATIPKARTP